MKTLILGFSRPKKLTLFAKSIMWADDILYDHVYVKWTWEKIERDIIYQASKLSVNFESNITFNEHALAIEEYEITVDDDCHKAIMQFCMDNSNKPYGFKEILGFAWTKSLKMIFRMNVKNPFPSKGNSYICSKIGAAILELTGQVKITEGLDDIDPLDLNNMVKAAGIKRIL